MMPAFLNATVSPGIEVTETTDNDLAICSSRTGKTESKNYWLTRRNTQPIQTK